MEPLLAHWRSGTKVGPGGECPGRQTVCVRRTMPALQSVSSVLSAKHNTPFPPRPGGVCLLQWPDKGQKSMGGQRELYIPSEQRESQSIGRVGSTFLSFHQTRQHIFCGEAVLSLHLQP